MSAPVLPEHREAYMAVFEARFQVRLAIDRCEHVGEPFADALVYPCCNSLARARARLYQAIKSYEGAK